MYQLKNHTTEETIAELKCLRKWVNSRPDEVEERIAQSEKQKKKDLTIQCLQETHFSFKETHRLKETG